MIDSDFQLNRVVALDRATAALQQDTCPVEVAAQILGQKWTLQIVYSLLRGEAKRFCELQDALGGVNPSTLSSRLKMLEEVGMVQRLQISAIPPHVEYNLTEMGSQLGDVIDEIARWSTQWLCRAATLDRPVREDA